MTVRTRIAPSPTGAPHVGTAYIALFNRCFAQQNNGQFILRIEDTDQARSTPDHENNILQALRWMGLTWDEGPDIGGPYGPYRQSERSHHYQQYAEQLVAQGHAFRCYRRPEELDVLRQALIQQGAKRALKHDDLVLSDEEVALREANGEPFVIRMHVPTEGPVDVIDRLRGTVTLDWSMTDAQVLIKSDGSATYHLANVVDDHLMQISHVLRGEEWLNSTPKHQLLYHYFGWDCPEWCHLPLLRNPDHSKLSKRKNPTSMMYYERMGYLPEALLNYLGRMGWSMPDEREKFSLRDMQQHFDLDRVSLGGPIFDLEKLNWLNGLWIREELTQEQLAQRLATWLLNKETLLKVLPHAQQRIETLSDFVPLTAFLGAGLLSITEQDFADSQLSGEPLMEAFQLLCWQLEALTDWEASAIFEIIKQLADTLTIKTKALFKPLFIAITGSATSISVTDAMVILGRDLSLARIQHAITALGGLAKKKLKKLGKTRQNQA